MNNDENTNNPSQKVTLQITNKKGRHMAVTIAWDCIGSEQQARVDVEIDNLLYQFVDQQITARKKDYARE